ncbi:MAG TPA: ABC transporter permease [Ktedonobacterales bacterium]|jgi:ABC-type transport system involved in multi-copper enzyme maturation permease subunit
MSVAVYEKSTTTFTRATKPSFPGAVRGEIFKQTHSRPVLGLAIMVLVMAALPALFLALSPGTKSALASTPEIFYFTVMGADLSVLRIFAGIFVLIATAMLVGQEYQNGTIRVLLSRGVDRVQLLLAKLLAMSLLVLALLAVALVVVALSSLLGIQIAAGSLDSLKVLNGDFWYSTWIYLLTVLISVGVSILLAACVAVVGRSLAFGVSAAIGWFAADNIGVLVMLLVYRFTQNDFWNQITGYFLGPTLNTMAAAVVPGLPISVTAPNGAVIQTTFPAQVIGFPPLVTYDGAHALVLTLVYAVVFLAIAVVLTWRRDVKE